MAVGIFDSGLGGLTVLEAVQERLPDVAFIYYGDNAHAPYGVRDADDVYDLTTRAVERLWEAARRTTNWGLPVLLLDRLLALRSSRA